MAFDPDAYLASDASAKSTPAPSKGFDPDAYLAKSTTAQQPQKFGVTTPEQQPATKGTDLGRGAAFGYGAGSAVAPGLTGLAAGAATAAAISPFAEAALAIPVAGPIVAGALELGGFGVGAYLGSEGIATIQNRLWSVMDPQGYANAMASMQAHPGYATAGGVVGGAVGLSPKVAVDQTAEIINTALKARAASAATQMGVSAGTQLATKGEVDPVDVLISGGVGAALPGVNRLGKPFEVAGRVAGKTVADVVTGKKVTPLQEEIQIPKEYTTPEQKKEFLERVMRERAAKAPLVEAALRNKETGEIERHGPKHDQARKEATKDTHEEGFVDALDNFHERQAAVDQAKRAGQIPEDHVLENPEGERPGLHTGDLRKAGDKRFEITDTQAAGKPKDPVTRDEHKQTINDLKEQYSILDAQRQIAELNGLEEDRVKYESQQKELRTKIEDLKKAMPGVQFKDARVPTWEELHEHLYDAKNLGEAFDTILDSNVGTRGLRLFTKALNTSDFIRSAKLNLTPKELKVNGGKSAPGYYTPADQPGKPGDTYSFHEGHTVNLGKDGSLRDLLHEGIHAGTHRLIEEGRSAAAIKLKELYEKYLDTAYAEIHEPKLEAFREANPQATVKELEAFRQDNTPYGSTNLHEFISEAFTNKKFKRELSKVKTTTPEGVLSNLWKDFKDAIREGLNLPEGERTLLDDVLDQGVALIEESKGFKPSESYGQVAAPAASKYDQLFPPLDEGKPTSSPDELAKDLAEKTTPEVAKAAQTVDVRSIPNEEEFYKHATNIYDTYGEEAALQFFDDYKKNLFERSIPVPNNNKELDDMLHKFNTYETKDRAEMATWMKEASKAGIDPKQAEEWFFMLEDGKELPPEASKWLQEGRDEMVALVRKAKGMGLEVGDEFITGQSRTRLFSEREKPGWKETLKKLFSSDDPMGNRVADTANAAIERKVFGLETWTSDPKVKDAAVKKQTGRVIELHRHLEDTNFSYQDESGKWQTVPVKKGTSIWEWKDGKRTNIGHSEKLDLKRGDTIELKVAGSKPEAPSFDVPATKDVRVIKSQAVISDGNVRDIENHSPYRYSHDPFLSQALARMGLRKMVREAEAVENLKKSELFKTVGHGPDQDLKTLPPGWIVPKSIDKIPQLRGWHFDPKTAAIISDFAKVWDNNMYMKLSNALIKNMMLNPVPHMFNEVMHLWNARGFSGWVDPRQLNRFANTARRAWNDVGNQSQFYRDIMREGGSILGADPRNKEFFDKMMQQQTRQVFGDPVMERNLSGLAKKLGTSVGDLYNGISKASQKAMWFTRDVMYVQYVREIMARHEKDTGSKMELKDAIEEAERHMPNYRMPSEVLGSRALSAGLKDPRLSQFSRYHYGMVKSLVNTVKDIDPRNLKTPEGRKNFRDGVDTMLAIGVAMGVLYPLMDNMAEAMFGEGAEQRRAGPFHLIQAGVDIAEGKKDLSALIYPVFTFNPVLLSLGQFLVNKNMFTGKSVYHPNDSIEDILSDIGAYGVKQVPQAAPILSATSEEGGDTQLLARQLDIKAKTPAQRAKEKRAKELEAKAKKSRDTKRAKGEYKP